VVLPGVPEDEEELLAPPPHEHVGRPDAPGYPGREFPQHLVAGRVSMEIVYRLEMIDVEDDAPIEPVARDILRTLLPRLPGSRFRIEVIQQFPLSDALEEMPVVQSG